MWTDRIKSEWERLTNAKNCICNVFIFPLPFLILSRALLFHLTAISSSAKNCHFVFQSDPVFCRVPNNHGVDASTLPPAWTHRGASMQTLTKPFKCPASGTKIGGNEISSQISRVHLNFILCGWTGVLTSRLWEMKLLLLYTSLTLIQEPHHSYCLTFDSETVGGKCVFGECFEGQWLSMKPCSQVAAESEPVQTGDRICNQSGLRAGPAGCGGPAPTPSWSNWVVCCLTTLAHTCAVVKDFSLWSYWSINMHEHKRCICYKSTDLGTWWLGQAKLGCTRCAFPTCHLINTPLLPPPFCPFSTAESRHKGTLSSWHIPLLINVMQCSHNTTTMPAM